MGYWKRLDFGNKNQNFLNSVFQRTMAKRGRWTCEEREEVVEIHQGLVAGGPMAAGGKSFQRNNQRTNLSMNPLGGKVRFALEQAGQGHGQGGVALKLGKK